MLQPFGNLSFQISLLGPGKTSSNALFASDSSLFTSVCTLLLVHRRTFLVHKRESPVAKVYFLVCLPEAALGFQQSLNPHS